MKKSSSTISILHLSDIHFKKKKDEKNTTKRNSAWKKLITTVNKHVQANGAPDFIAVTGDIAFSGKEYDNQTKTFFDEIKKVTSTKSDFLIVPGNHDVDHSKVDDVISLYDVIRKEQIDNFLDDRNKMKIKNFVNPKFRKFRQFVEQFHPKELYKPRDNYFWVKDFPDKDVSFLGLNTCWASEGDEDRFNIALGFSQVVKVLEMSSEKIKNKIALMHHPPFYWLNEKDFGKCSTELYKHVKLLLHGHSHFDSALVFQSPSDSCICLGANASYTNDKDGFIGFQFIQVVFQDENTSLKVWPYIYDERNLEFLPDYRRWRNQRGK